MKNSKSSTPQSLLDRIHGKDLVASIRDGALSFEILGSPDGEHISAEDIDQAMSGYSRYTREKFLSSIIVRARLITDENGDDIVASDEFNDLDSDT